jgi:hypothetical protein
MQVYKDGRVAHYREFFPNVSFPAFGPSDTYLAGAGAVKVNVFREHNRATQKLVPCDPVVENGWAYTVKVEDKTAEEIAADVASKAAQVRAQRDRLLSGSDWTQVADAPVDKVVWATYRQALRDLPEQEGFPNIEMPSQPGGE